MCRCVDSTQRWSAAFCSLPAVWPALQMRPTTTCTASSMAGHTTLRTPTRSAWLLLLQTRQRSWHTTRLQQQHKQRVTHWSSTTLLTGHGMSLTESCCHSSGSETMGLRSKRWAAAPRAGDRGGPLTVSVHSPHLLRVHCAAVLLLLLLRLLLPVMVICMHAHCVCVLRSVLPPCTPSRPPSRRTTCRRSWTGGPLLLTLRSRTRASVAAAG